MTIQPDLMTFSPDDIQLASRYLNQIISGERPQMHIPPLREDYDLVFARVLIELERKLT